MTRLNQYTDDYTVFDLETTGLSPEADAIIEISGIKVCGHRAVEEFTTLVNPGRPIPRSATNINGITDDMVQNAPMLRDALEAFLAFAGEDILVGHNIHSFDMNFLLAGARRELGCEIGNDYIDTLYLARSVLPLSRFRLKDISEYFGIETKGAHRALADCSMNQQCYEKMRVLWERQQEENRTAPSCPRCGSPLIRRKGRYGEFWGCAGYPQCRYTKNV